ncbi:LysR substrate-binding domain-containing protein [Streptomyces diastatochromogenes]|nr:LysR substrate-binding domain-containing protein [Streptomyces diastatochromogenes]
MTSPTCRGSPCTTGSRSWPPSRPSPRRAGRRLHLAHRINEFAVVAEAVAAGGGIALMPRWTMRPHPALVLRPLSGVQATRHIDVLCRPERTARKAVRTVLTELRRAARTIQGEVAP